MDANAWTVWQRTPDDGEAASGATGTGATSARAGAECEASEGRSQDAYGCVDWFDFAPARDEDRRRSDGRGVPA